MSVNNVQGFELSELFLLITDLKARPFQLSGGSESERPAEDFE
jgi:hypothetical protein